MLTQELKDKLDNLAKEMLANGVSLIAHAAAYTANSVETATVLSIHEMPEASVDHQYADAVVKLSVEWFNKQHKSTLCWRPGEYQNRKKS